MICVIDDDCLKVSGDSSIVIAIAIRKSLNACGIPSDDISYITVFEDTFEIYLRDGTYCRGLLPNELSHGCEELVTPYVFDIDVSG